MPRAAADLTSQKNRFFPVPRPLKLTVPLDGLAVLDREADLARRQTLQIFVDRQF